MKKFLKEWGFIIVATVCLILAASLFANFMAREMAKKYECQTACLLSGYAEYAYQSVGCFCVKDGAAIQVIPEEVLE